MAPTILYAACVFGALALYMVLRPGPRPVKIGGAIVGLGTLAWVLKETTAVLAPPGTPGPSLIFILFAFIAVASAVRMITHHRPVYAALYFVMVVLSSAGLFLLLEAEFLAFALVIVYAGAILVTYLFVLMLAHQAPEADDPASQPEYDRVPREPAAAVVVGFFILALLSDMMFAGAGELPPPPSDEQVRRQAWEQLDSLPDRVDHAVRRELALPPRTAVRVIADERGHLVRFNHPDNEPVVRAEIDQGIDPQTVRLPDSASPENIELVGLALIKKFPVSLELAGVILLMAMFGAVVLARRQIELSEDEKRMAAGMVPLSADEGDLGPGPGGGGE